MCQNTLLYVKHSKRNKGDAAMTKNIMTYTAFGVSFCKGQHRLRFSQDKDKRMAQLISLGDTDVNMVDLPSAMQKLQAVQWAQASGQFEAEHEKTLIAAFIEKNSKTESAEPKKRGRPRKNPVAAAPTLETVAAESDAADDSESALDALAEQNIDVDAMSDEELLAMLEEQDETNEQQEEAVA
jgi:hypothetical protein